MRRRMCGNSKKQARGWPLHADEQLDAGLSEPQWTPSQPWLEPDICDYLRAQHTAGLERVILCPIGFMSDHMEVLYDLDTEARDYATKWE